MLYISQKRMKTSSYFEEALFDNQSRTTAQFFDDKSNELFEELKEFEEGKVESFVEIDIQTPRGPHLHSGLQNKFWGLDSEYVTADLSHLDDHDGSWPAPINRQVSIV